MIQVILRNDSLTLTGHANSNKKGQDFVCCGASTIIYTTTSWFEKDDINFTEDESIPLIEIKLKKKTIKNKEYLQLAYQQLVCLAKHNKKYMKCKTLK